MCRERVKAVSILAGLTAAVLAWHSCTLGDGIAPRAGFVVPVEVVEWHDGDTCTVRATVEIRVRLLDCWAPEVHGRSLTDAERKMPPEKQKLIQRQIAEEKQRGFDSRTSAIKFAPVGAKGVLEIPFDGATRSDDLFTMGRVLGRVWVDGKNVSALQVDSGHATAVK